MTVALQELADRVRVARGVQHRLAYKALKAYMSSLSEAKFVEEVSRMTDARLIRYLFAAGLSAKRQSVVTLRWTELEK